MCIWSFIKEVSQFHGLLTRDQSESREGESYTWYGFTKDSEGGAKTNWMDRSSE